NNNNNSNNNNNNNSTTPAVTASAANTQVTITNSGGWSSGSSNCSQYTVTIKNTGSSAVNNWKVTVSFGGNITLDQSWNGNFSASGSNITITPVDFNNEISAGQSVEVGFIISYSGNVGTPTVSIN
ncbi:MAG: cellulose binding domain-containing protein, partial [Lachnospiraceae bacterium]|nr:cellulose binding domain-containing protein [Lachnospiraceae bacterium]